MSTSMSKPTRKGVEEAIDKARSRASLTSLYAMRKAMNTRRLRSMGSMHAFGTPKAKPQLMPIIPTK